MSSSLLDVTNAKPKDIILSQQSAMNTPISPMPSTKKYQIKQRRRVSSKPLASSIQDCFKLTPHSRHFEALTLDDEETEKESGNKTDYQSSDYNDGDFDIDIDDFTVFECAGNVKCKGKNCRSTIRNKQPKVRPCKLVSAHDITKDLKRMEQIHDNYSKQKSNVSAILANKGMLTFGFDIYSRRAELGLACRSKKTCSINQHSRQIRDPPSVLKYELKNDKIPKESNYLLSIVDLQHRELTPEDYELLLLLDTSVAPKTVEISCLKSILSVSVSEMLDLTHQYCSICMEMYETMDTVKKLPCEHIFHSSCIDHWLSQSSQNCPLDGLVIFA